MRYGRHVKNNSRQAAWAATLDTSEADLPFALDSVTRLFVAVRTAALRAEQDAFAGIPDHLRTLAREVLPHGGGFDAGASHPDRTALEMLASFSAYLEAVEPDGVTPDEAEVDGLREEVRDLLAAVASAEHLPPEVKRLLHQRLAEVLEALDHLRTQGPDNVARAAEALGAVATLITDDAAGEDGALVTRVKLLARRTWTAVKVVAVMSGLALDWDNIVVEKQLEPGPEIRQLESGPSAPDEPDDSGPEPEEPAGPDDLVA